MTTPPDHDVFIESLQNELRAQLEALNELHHPVYPSSPGRLAELERRVEELRAAISARRSDLTVSAARSAVVGRAG